MNLNQEFVNLLKDNTFKHNESLKTFIKNYNIDLKNASNNDINKFINFYNTYSKPFLASIIYCNFYKKDCSNAEVIEKMLNDEDFNKDIIVPLKELNDLANEYIVYNKGLLKQILDLEMSLSSIAKILIKDGTINKDSSLKDVYNSFRINLQNILPDNLEVNNIFIINFEKLNGYRNQLCHKSFHMVFEPLHEYKQNTTSLIAYFNRIIDPFLLALNENSKNLILDLQQEEELKDEIKNEIKNESQTNIKDNILNDNETFNLILKITTNSKKELQHSTEIDDLKRLIEEARSVASVKYDKLKSTLLGLEFDLKNKIQNQEEYKNKIESCTNKINKLANKLNNLELIKIHNLEALVNRTLNELDDRIANTVLKVLEEKSKAYIKEEIKEYLAKNQNALIKEEMKSLVIKELKQEWKTKMKGEIKGELKQELKNSLNTLNTSPKK